MQQKKNNIVTIFKKAGYAIFLALLVVSWFRVEASTGTPLVVFNERIERVGGNVLISWETNIPATGRVLYGSSSVPVPGLPLSFEGYEQGTPNIHAPLEMKHKVTAFDVDSVQARFFRPLSKAGDKLSFGRELVLDNAVQFVNPTFPVVVGTPVLTGCPYMNTHLKFGEINNFEEVRKLQEFLRVNEGESLIVTGVFDAQTFNAVKRFQEKYAKDILKPWGYTEGTGYVYMLTQKKINELHCNTSFPLTFAQQEEIRAYVSRSVTAPVSSTSTPKPVEIVEPLIVEPLVATTTATSTVSEKPFIAPISVISSTSTVSSVATTTAILNTPSTSTVSPIALALDGGIKTSGGDAVSLLFSLPKSSAELIRTTLSFFFILLIIYIVSNFAVHQMSNESTPLTLVRTRKLGTYIVGLGIATILTALFGLFSLVLPFIIVMILLGIALFVYKQRTESVQAF